VLNGFASFHFIRTKKPKCNNNNKYLLYIIIIKKLILKYLYNTRIFFHEKLENKTLSNAKKKCYNNVFGPSIEKLFGVKEILFLISKPS